MRAENFLYFNAVPWVCLQFVIVVFRDHTHYFAVEVSTEHGEDSYQVALGAMYTETMLCGVSGWTVVTGLQRHSSIFLQYPPHLQN